MKAVLLILLMVVIADAAAPISCAQRRSVNLLLEAALTEYAIDADAYAVLSGKSANILLNNGQRVEGTTIQSIGQGRDKSVFRTVTVRQDASSKTRRYPAGLLYRLDVAGVEYRVTRIPSKRAFALIDEPARRRAISERLAGRRDRLWPKLTADQQQQHVQELKTFLSEVSNHFAPLRMQLHETGYFLFLTDMPPAQIGPYLQNLDRMNERLGQAFGFEPGANVWYGKAAVVAFVNRDSFQEFERHFMNNPGVASYQGFCHQNSLGRVVVGCYRGDDRAFFGSLLVHETSHGYVHRYRSTARLPSWLNEGIADWIAMVTVPSSNAVLRRQQRSADRLRQLGTFGSQFFGDEKIAVEWYGAASSCVDLLIKQSPEGFRVFVDGIKEGYTWEESLQRAYGLTPAGLAAFYGHSIGVPTLNP